MLRLVIAVALLTASAATQANPVEVWQCRDLLQPKGEVLVTATVEDGRVSGKIVVAGVTQQAHFQVAGFDRRWDFGMLSDGSFQYSFVIKPNGTGAYYDFQNGKSASPTNIMKCSQVGASKAPKNSDAPPSS